MIHDWKMGIYWRLPVIFQEAGLSLYARHLEKLYYRDGYEEWRQRFHSWQAWSHSDAEAWQSQQLRSIVQLAATKVPYYRNQWRNLDWKSVRSTEDLHLLPRLDKQAIRQNEAAFINEGLTPNSLWVEKTSGTTGTSLRIYWPKAMLPKWWALTEVMVRNVAGVRQAFPRAMMGGRSIVRGDASHPPYWRFNRRWRQLYLSSYHVSKNSAPEYVAAMEKYGSRWITGYGSAIAALAESALEAGVTPLPLRAVIVSGDTLLPGMRSSIEQFFKCKCFDSYGQCEGVCMAMECPEGRMHLLPAAGVLEILRQDGSSCVPGEIGEMVATSLLNDAMPLIRYRLGDYAAWAENQSCPCGNFQPIITNLEGRVDDYLITLDGRKIGRLSTAMKRSPTIHSAQIVQDRPGHAYLLVRPGRGYKHGDAIAVRDDFLERVGAFDLEVLQVSEIPKTLQGKSALVVRLAERPEMKDVYNNLLKGRYRPHALTETGTTQTIAQSASARPLCGTKVLVITSGHEATDARIYARQACSLQNLGADVTVVGKLENSKPGEVTVLPVPRPSSRLARFLWQPWRCLWAARRLQADIIHFHDAEMLITLPLAKLWWWRTKFVYDVHEDFANLMRVRDWLFEWLKPIIRVLLNILEKGLGLLADAIIGVTPPLADKFQNKHKIVAYNYIPLEFFEHANRVSREPREREYDLVHLGTLSEKRAIFLADTLQAFHQLRPGARSLVIGVSPEIELVIKERIPKDCVLLGKLLYSEIPSMLANAKVGLDVHPWLDPHLMVALPVKVCEYMAAGCAVVASSMPVLNQILDEAGPDSDALKTIDGGTPLDYAKAAARTMQEIERGADPGLKLRKVAHNCMTWEQEAGNIANLYLQLLGKPCAI